jgi:hypothetical protein
MRGWRRRNLNGIALLLVLAIRLAMPKQPSFDEIGEAGALRAEFNQPPSVQAGASAADPAPRPTPADPMVNDRYRSGKVVALNGDRAIVENVWARAAVRLPDPAQIWKGGWNATPIEVGDWLTATGDPRGRDGFQAETVYLNIANWRGRVVDPHLTNGSLHFNVRGVRLRYPQPGVVEHEEVILGEVELTPTTEMLFDDRPGAPPTTSGLDPIALRPEQLVEVIGVRLPNGTVRATRVFVAR